MTVTVHHGDSREVLKTLADATVDSVVCDPPYALVSIGKRFGAENAAPAKRVMTGAYARASAGFMGQKWDTGETAFDPAFWVEVLRVLKPGGHLIAFSGTRTYHRLACAIEDAGFEMRDMIAWLYGSGFPKSHNVREDGWEGWGTALKPALEPIVLARKPLAGTVAANVLTHGTGALNIDASRIDAPNGLSGGGQNNTVAFRTSPTGDHARSAEHPKGRWPANVIHDGSEEVISAFPDGGGNDKRVGVDPGRRPGGFAGVGASSGSTVPNGALYGDAGTAARFFYSAKADAADRCGSKHPTVKPIDLMAYLCRLVTRPGGVVLDPFAGSGTTGMACLREGFDCILIEREAQYVEDIHRRLQHVEGRDTPLFAASNDEPTLFDSEAA
jgi:site-specific DNA-methyltransferase (adenine-specific)